MNKSIALIALLLPFSGYTQTKQEREQELTAKMNKATERLLSLQAHLGFSTFLMLFGQTEPIKELREELIKCHEEMEKLAKESAELEAMQ